jgi:predicted metalloendopeptidase
MEGHLFQRRILRGIVFAVICTALALAFVARSASTNAAEEKQAAQGYDPADLDRTCRACDDFFQFAVGGWLKRNPIPEDYSSWGVAQALGLRNQQQLRQILEAAAAGASAAPGSNEQKIGDFYASCMDTSAVEAQGLKPLRRELDRISAIHDRDGLIVGGAHLQMAEVGVLFTFGSDQDFKDSTSVIGEANQGGLGLPERDYYTREDEKSTKLREQYVEHVAKMLELLGEAPEKTAREARSVMTIETGLAKASMTNVELRDPQAIYHKMKLSQVQSLTPNFSWETYLPAVGSGKLGELNIGQPEFFKALNGMLASVSVEDWKAYYRWHLVDHWAAMLPERFVQEDFDFNGRVLKGAKQILPRWQRCSQSVDAYLGEALGQAYVQKHFPSEAKARALEMTHNLLSALRDDLQTLTWMSPKTREAAIVKLDAFHVKIGYPDKWRDYSALRIERTSLLQNTIRGAEFERARQIAKIGKPLDYGEWDMTPPTVNAYYNPQKNEIVFPAGILQPPFFDPARDDAYNYGGMGAVIGHEITHGFDDEGSQFDGQGNLKNWWTADDMKNFQERGECVVKQFDGFMVEGDLHENGKLVEGESIADLGGLVIAYAAYHKSLEGGGGPKGLGGFTADQRFFLGSAQSWAENDRVEYARLLTNSDPHPLPKFRANGPVSNMDAFARAFSCKKGDAMVRAQACKIW